MILIFISINKYIIKIYLMLNLIIYINKYQYIFG